MTIARQNPTVQQMISKWMEYAKEGKYKEIMIDTAENSYTEEYLKGDLCPVHHSESYREKEHPAYRVITGQAIKALECLTEKKVLE